MNAEEYQRAKKANDRAGLFIVLAFVIWLPTYLLVFRPMINEWVFQYIQSYRAMLHLLPIFAPLVLFGFIISKIYPAPKPPPPPSGAA